MRTPKAPPASRIVAVLSWAVALLLAGAVTSWAVTAIAGEQGPARDRVLDASDVVAALAGQAAAPGATQTPTQAPTSIASASAAPLPVPDPSSAGAVPPPTPTAKARPTAPVRPSEASSAAPSASMPEVYRFWSVAGGQVGAKCRGAALGDVYFTPADGWTMEVKHNAPDGLEVTFHRDGSETSVHVTCVAGVPTNGVPTAEPGSGVPTREPGSGD